MFLKQGDSSIVLPVSRNGEFKANLDLKQGTNYFDLLLMQDGVEVGKQSLTFYVKSQQDDQKERVMWVETASLFTSTLAFGNCSTHITRSFWSSC